MFQPNGDSRKNHYPSKNFLKDSSRQSGHILRREHGAEVMFVEQFAEAGDGALFILAEVKMDVPLEIIAPEILVEFPARLDDALQRFQAELLRLLEFAAQFAVFNPAPQRPDGIDKWQLRQFQPRGAEVENLVRVRRALEINRPVADEQDKIFFGGGGVIFQRLEFRLQSAFGQQDF